MAETILQSGISAEQRAAAAARLPAMRPVEGGWLRVDDAYEAQMAERRHLIAQRRSQVIAMAGGEDAADEMLSEVLTSLPDGFGQTQTHVRGPDGARNAIDRADPLGTIGRIIQQDVCLLEKRGDAHVLTGAVLCFPASWTLAQKVGRPLMAIHTPVAAYDAAIGARVQRLFDGVQVGRPLWRANLLRYDDPSLFQPRPEHDPRPIHTDGAEYIRSERQTVLRLPKTKAVAFVIHTSVVRESSENGGDSRKDQSNANDHEAKS